MGALTIKPLAYKIRSWELTTREVVNFLDPFCSQLVIQKRGDEIMRILPSRKEDFFWISDKIRFLFEGLKKQRIEFPYLIFKEKYFKISTRTSVLFMQYFFFIIIFLQELNKGLDLLGIKAIKAYKNVVINKLNEDIDLMSRYLLNMILLKSNLIKNQFNNYLGNINSYYNFKDSKVQKFNIVNNVDIINKYPRMWSAIRETKLFILGKNSFLNFNCYHLNIFNNELCLIKKYKSIIGLLGGDHNIYTEKVIQGLGAKQIFLTSKTEKYNNYIFDNKINYNKTKKELISWIFCRNLENEEKGIQISLQTHGSVKNNEGIILSVTNFLEENSIRLTDKGQEVRNLSVVNRKIEQRSIIQFLLVVKNIFKEKEEKINLNFFKGIMLLRYGLIKENLKNFKEYNKIPYFIVNKFFLRPIQEREFFFENSEVIKIKKNLKIQKKKNNY
jgi:hypothetical protein